LIFELSDSTFGVVTRLELGERGIVIRLLTETRCYYFL